MHHQQPAHAGGVRRAGLGLQGEPGVERGHHAAGLGEGEAPEVPAQPVHDSRGALQAVHGGISLPARQVAGDREVVAQPVAGALLDREPPGHEEGEIGGHRTGAPVVRRALGCSSYPDQAATGHDLVGARDGEVEVHPRLVERMVVRREPPGGHVRLVQGHGLGAVGHPVALAAPRHAPGVTGVRDPDPHRRTRGEWLMRPDHQLVPVRAAERGAAGREVHRAHREQEVEVEGAQLLGGAQRDRRPARDPARGEVVGVVHVVRPDVDAAVAVEWEVRVADAGRPGDRGLAAGRGGGPADHQGRGDHEGGGTGQHGEQPSRESGCGRRGAPVTLGSARWKRHGAAPEPT